MAERKPQLKNATGYANKLKELGCKNIETYRSSVSGEMRPFSYNGKVITASSKEDAIKQVVTAAKRHHKMQMHGPEPGLRLKFESFFKSMGFKKNKEWDDLVLNKVIMSQKDFYEDDGFYLAFDDGDDYNTEYEFNSRNLIDAAIEKGLTDKEAEKVVKDFAETLKKVIKKNVGKLKKVKSARELRAITKTFPELKVNPNKSILDIKKKIESNKSLLRYAIDDIEHNRDYKKNIKKVINNLQKLL